MEEEKEEEKKFLARRNFIPFQWRLYKSSICLLNTLTL